MRRRLMGGLVGVWLLLGRGAGGQEGGPLITLQPSWLAIRQITIPMAESSTGGLESWLVTPVKQGKYPMVVMTPDDLSNSLGENVARIGPGRMLPEAEWFVRRGWAVGIVMPRGYGESGHFPKPRVFFHCGKDDLVPAVESDTADLQAAVAFLDKQPEVDGSRIILADEHSYWPPNIWLTAAGPSIKAIIHLGALDTGLFKSFDFPFGNRKCLDATILPAFQRAGGLAHVPMLWIYDPAGNKNEAAGVQESRETFVQAGGNVELDFVTHYRKDDGMYLFNMDEAEWGPLVEAFLAKQGWPATAMYPRPATAMMKLPASASAEAQKAFAEYLLRGPNKVFAFGRNGGWAIRVGMSSLQMARKEALDLCPSCVIVAEEEAKVEK